MINALEKPARKRTPGRSIAGHDWANPRRRPPRCEPTASSWRGGSERRKGEIAHAEVEAHQKAATEAAGLARQLTDLTRRLESSTADHAAATKTEACPNSSRPPTSRARAGARRDRLEKRTDELEKAARQGAGRL
ncbi:MAG: hypothetical protein U1F87_02065 [Kiritimatiellia bacterium]